ncbi:MAG TPA: hypothetical protein V6C97_28730 [Oculatellaceae cyanobacterium]
MNTRRKYSQAIACLATVAAAISLGEAAFAQNSASAQSAGASSDSSTSSGAGERGLGSFLKQEFRNQLNSGRLQNVQRYNAYPSQQQQPMQYIRQPDGSMKTYGANGAMGGNVQVQQMAPRMTGDALGYVTSNMPVDVSGGVDSLIPRELHQKAYGPELQRSAPLNGAEGYSPNQY